MRLQEADYYYYYQHAKFGRDNRRTPTLQTKRGFYPANASRPIAFCRSLRQNAIGLLTTRRYRLKCACVFVRGHTISAMVSRETDRHGSLRDGRLDLSSRRSSSLFVAITLGVSKFGVKKERKGRFFGL